MKNLKIWAKLLITFMMIIVLFCGTVTIAVTGLKQSADKYSEFYNVEYQITNRIMNMRRGLQIIVKDLTFITVDQDQARKTAYLDDLHKELSALEENAAWVSEHFTGSSELLNAFSENTQAAIEMQETIIQTADVNMASAQDMLLNDYQPLVEEAVNTLIQISQSAESDATKNYEENSASQETLVTLQLGMAGIALLITLVLSLYLTRSITRPLHELEKSADKIVHGDFDIAITYKSKDELGSLANAFRNMTVILETVISDASMLLGEMANGNFDVRTRAEERYVGSFQGLLQSIRKLNRDLSITLGQINQSADQVASRSDQVSGGSQTLSQGATEQAAAVEELAATISDISQQIKETADNALEAKNQSNTAGDKVEQCNGQMRDMMDAMEKITRAANEISKIIKTIEDIAFQTNILALNAAVEASRAGTAGKGFAVVADEVRTLASKSTIASKDTAELIESAIKAVADGTQIADLTAQSMITVREQVSMAATKVDKIADAAKDQASSVEQVTLGVEQISCVVQNNSATAVESASASEELSSQAAKLKNLVSKFVLREEYASGNHMMNNGSNYSQTPGNKINLD